MMFFQKSDAFYLLLSFFILITLGACLLSIPGVWQDHLGKVAFIDAYFVATSAVCNAGLSTLNLSDMTRPGQIIIIFLMQTGGLGIISFSCLLTLIPGNRFALSRRTTIQGFYLDGVEYRPKIIVRNIIIFTVIFETLGTLLLILLFRKAGIEDAAFQGLFHGISAFCNTGLSLFPDQLRRFDNNPPVLITVMLLVLFGGVGFIVLHDLLRLIRDRLRGKKRRLSYHSRVVLAMTGVIALSGTLFYFFAEHGRLYRSINLQDEWLMALFQTINPRSGGFDVIPQDQLSQPSKLFTCLLMLSGGAPGAISGGIKLTTLFVIFAVIFRKPDAEGDIIVFHHRLTRNTIHNAVVYVLKALTLLIIFIGALSVIEGLHGKPFALIGFEVFSAFGTVGLSLGITADLSTPGKLVVIAAMFAGRVGLIALAFPRNKQYAVNYPEGFLLLG
ncbi:MAG: hypothetical protein LBG73_05910 [Spirochaetaceae bacterium]|jgi:trk system potassium uptake protein TrkH|nr:hypothetical protein [Spirochaetaceae bacterium]